MSHVINETLTQLRDYRLNGGLDWCYITNTGLGSLSNVFIALFIETEGQLRQGRVQSLFQDYHMADNLSHLQQLT